MKYMIYLLAALYIIGGIYFINIFFLGSENKKLINIEKITQSIVIIIPEQKLISYKNNPKGLFENYKNSGIGLGFITNTQGIITTVNHIVENDKINYKIIYNGKEYNSKIFYRNKEKDIANLVIDTNQNLKYIALKTTSKINISDKIYSFGVDSKKLEIIYNTGILINKKSKLENKSNLLEISNPLKPGFSGGPIINSNGEVIGINYAISEGKNYGMNLTKNKKN